MSLIMKQMLIVKSRNRESPKFKSTGVRRFAPRELSRKAEASLADAGACYRVRIPPRALRPALRAQPGAAFCPAPLDPATLMRDGWRACPCSGR